MAMQRNIICRERGGLSGGLLPVLPLTATRSREPVRGGAGNPGVMFNQREP